MRKEINKRTTAENEFVVLKKVRTGSCPLGVQQGEECRGEGGRSQERLKSTPCRRAWAEGPQKVEGFAAWGTLMFI